MHIEIISLVDGMYELIRELDEDISEAQQRYGRLRRPECEPGVKNWTAWSPDQHYGINWSSELWFGRTKAY